MKDLDFLMKNRGNIDLPFQKIFRGKIDSLVKKSTVLLLTLIEGSPSQEICD